MSVQNTLTQDRLKEVLSYDPETGEFTWRSTGPGRRPNRKAGSKNNLGYMVVTIDRQFFLVHRLAWFYVTGAWPKKQLDHINGDRTDNRFVNLRETDWQGNQQNLPATNGKGRLRGATKLNNPTFRSTKYAANIKHNRQQIYLGIFSTEQEAHEAYLKAKAELHAFQPTPRAA